MAKTGAQNVINDDTFPTDLPVTQVDDLQLDQEKRMARYSQSKEFQYLKEYLESRIDFFQKYLPDGTAVAKQPNEEAWINWKVANIVISEFKTVIESYENAAQAVKDATERP